MNRNVEADVFSAFGRALIYKTPQKVMRTTTQKRRATRPLARSERFISVLHMHWYAWVVFFIYQTCSCHVDHLNVRFVCLY